MPYRKSTLRRMTPEARKLAKLVGELESVARRLKHLVGAVQSFEMWERADKKRRTVDQVARKEAYQEGYERGEQDAYDNPRKPS